MTVSYHLQHALRIQRDVKPANWPAALERLPEEARGPCEAYLRGIAQRMRNARAAKAGLPKKVA